MKELIKELTIEQIPEPYREIAAAIGVENLLRLAEIKGGATIYVPKPEAVVRPARDARLKEEFTGYNHTELARKYQLSERWVREICGKGYPKGQLAMFETNS